MINQYNPSTILEELAIDTRGVDQLKLAARQESPEAIKGVAIQFEAIFLNMLMKSMRNASPQDGPFDSEQSKMFISMLDQQVSQNLAQRGIGLADVLTRHLLSSLAKSVGPDDHDNASAVDITLAPRCG